MPELHRGQFRLPWQPAPGPAPHPPIPVWQRRHEENWRIWSQQWSAAGFPEDLPPDLCFQFHQHLNQVTQRWVDSDAPAADLPRVWGDVIDAYDGDGPEQHSLAIWAFGLWGRYQMYDFIEAIEDPDIQQAIETQYLQLLDDLPVSQLLDRLERLHRFVPPDPRPDLAPSIVAPDQRCSASKKSLYATFPQSFVTRKARNGLLVAGSYTISL